VIDLEKLKSDIPAIAADLGVKMVTDGLPAFQSCGLTLDDASTSVSLTFTNTGGDLFRVSLTIESGDGSDDADDDSE
jgi:hypothetical protein